MKKNFSFKILLSYVFSSKLWMKIVNDSFICLLSFSQNVWICFMLQFNELIKHWNELIILWENNIGFSKEVIFFRHSELDVTKWHSNGPLISEVESKLYYWLITSCNSFFSLDEAMIILLVYLIVSWASIELGIGFKMKNDSKYFKLQCPNSKYEGALLENK